MAVYGCLCGCVCGCVIEASALKKPDNLILSDTNSVERLKLGSVIIIASGFTRSVLDRTGVCGGKARYYL